jgi:hypothetical protein
LEILQDAYPAPMAAKDLRERAVSQYQREVNPNTLTVSLARCREEGIVALANKRWSYVPRVGEIPIARRATTGSGDHPDLDPSHKATRPET